MAVTTTMGSYNNTSYALNHLIDQSGMSTPYVSGTTAFDAFAAGTTSNYGIGTSAWYSASSTTKGFLSFDLGAAYNIDGLAWFGLSTANRVTGIKVYADNDSDATNGNAGLLFDSGTFDSAAGTTGDFSTANVFSFSSAANTRYLDIEIVSNGGGAVSGLGEVVFRESMDAPVAAVPEPETYALMGLGLLALGVIQRRRSAQR